MMCSTLSTSTANCIVLRQFRSACTTTLATLRWTNTSPGAMSMIWFAGTRESEQPIHKYFGACCCDRRSKNCASCLRTFADQARFFSIRLLSFVMSCRILANAKEKRFNHEGHKGHEGRADSRGSCFPYRPRLHEMLVLAPNPLKGVRLSSH